jgi:hypothetical protein
LSGLSVADPQSTIRDLTKNEIKLKKDIIVLGDEIFKFYAQEEIVNAKSLDDVYRLWVLDPRQEKFQNKDVIYGLAILYGNFLVTELDGEWKTIIDQYGAGFAILYPGGSTTFPVDMVAKRIKRGNKEFGFFNANFSMMKNVVSQLSK